MTCSPLSTPGVPRTASPLPSDDDADRPHPPAPDDAHAMATQHETEPTWQASVSAGAAGAPSPDLATPTAPKGKEKAVKSPLRLLDLPMDILKEIIHQVLSAPVPPMVAMRRKTG
jgi:hypothetical protein